VEGGRTHMKTRAIIYCCFVFLAFLGCKDQGTNESDGIGELIYSNSFESQSDTIGWTGYGSLVFDPSTPPRGGSQSARISGGCPVPHACTKVRVQSEGGVFMLQCWGKNLALAGTVELYTTSNPFAGISVQVADTAWTRYRSDNSLICPAGDTLVLAMNSGGIVSSAMLVDLVEIYRIQ
jgi:hypothetical protein